MFQQQYANEETIKAERARPLFGPVRPDEVQLLAWDWRREFSRGLLLAIEGMWLLAWALFFIRLNGPLSPRAAQILVGGWFVLALLALSSGHLVVRLEERVGWGRTRLFLSGLIVVSTSLWWAAVSGGGRAFLSDIGNALHLRPGPGFWALWLAIIAWMRGMEWSQQMVGVQRARSTMHGGLLLLGVLALIGLRASEVPTLLPALAVLWVSGLIALGLVRLVAEDWALALTRPTPFILRQSTLLAGAALATLSGGLGALWLLEPTRRAAISQWVQAQSEAPAHNLGMVLLHLAIIVLALIWRVVYWVAVELTAMLGITFSPSPQYQPPSTEPSTDYLLALLNLVPPYVWFGLRVGLFLLFLAWVLFLLLTKMDRVRYVLSQQLLETSSESPNSLLPRLVAYLPRLTLPRLMAAEPQDIVRRIYVRLVRLGVERGATWGARNTPYEHEASLQAVLPEHADEIHLITEQYVRVRYAGEALAPHDIKAVQLAWQRLSAALR